MPDLTIAIAAETPCGNCGAASLLVELRCPSCSCDILPRIGFDEFVSDLTGRRILDARPGGLVIGRDNDDDDIPMYRDIGNGVFQIMGLMQGGEFILSAAATRKHMATLVKINSSKGENPRHVPLTYSPRASVINTNLLPPFGALWIDAGQFIINRFATAKHFEELERLNAEADPANISGGALLSQS